MSFSLIPLVVIVVGALVLFGFVAGRGRKG